MEKGSLRLFLIISGPGTWSQQIIDFDYYTHGLLILIFNTHQKAKRKNEWTIPPVAGGSLKLHDKYTAAIYKKKQKMAELVHRRKN